MNFFNRSREMRLLSVRMKTVPSMNVLTGPADSGKSLILRKLVEELKATNVPVVEINMRSVSFNSVDTLVLTLQNKFNPWLDQFKDFASHFKLDAGAYGFNLAISMEGKSKPPIAKLNDLLGVFDGKLPPCTFWHGTKAPVFIIDEANELNKLTEQPDGHDALHNFFKWLVMNTKELNCFHVILSSSDSFFHLWVSNYVGAHRFKTWVIGDLPEGEAVANNRLSTDAVPSEAHYMYIIS